MVAKTLLLDKQRIQPGYSQVKNVRGTEPNSILMLGD